MREYFIWGGVLLCLASIWAMARHDWIRLTRPKRQVLARLSGHRLVSGHETRSYAACYAFEAEGRVHEVVDQLAQARRKGDEGDVVPLVHPAGRPDLARPPRPVMWVALYLGLLIVSAMLAAEGLWPGILPES